MTDVDQFESVFRSAAKEVYEHAPLALARILVLTDLPPEGAAELHERVRAFLAVLGDEPEWRDVTLAEVGGVADLLALVREVEPDLVCTYRNLGSEAWRWPYSLGEYVDVLTQEAPCPVLLLPHPAAGRAYEHALRDTDVVVALTDHLSGEAGLVRQAVHYTNPGGRLILAHVEDYAVFARYLDAISKIPAIDTETARETLQERLLKEPADYAASVGRALEAAGVDVRVEARVGTGHRLEVFRRLVEETEADLLVCNTKDEDQLAMHGLAYPLAVELRELPLLLL